MSTDPATRETLSPSRPGWLPTGAAFLAVVALLVLAFNGLSLIGSLAAPVFLALTLVLTIDPLRRWLVAKGTPMWLATVAMLAVLYAVLLAVLAGVGLALSQLVTVLPTYQQEFADRYQQLVDLAARWNFELGTIEEALRKIEPSNIIPILQAILGGVGSVGSTVAFLLLAIAFLTMDLSQAGARLAVVSRRRPHLAEALRDFARSIRRYWGVSTLFGLAQAVLIVILLSILGVPLPLVWGILSFLTNYIPNVGFVLALIPAALLGLLSGGVTTMLLVIAGYLVINFVTQTLLQPKFMGEAVGLNVTTTFLSMIFWTVVIGPLGALLAVPLTMFTKAVLIDSDPRSQWLAAFISADPPVPAEVVPTAATARDAAPAEAQP